MRNITTSVPALDKVMRVLNYIGENPGKNFSQIQEDLQLPRSSTSSLLNALLAHNLIRKEKNIFFLGVSLTTLGNASLEQRDICHVARPILTELRDKTQLTCHLGVLQNTVAIYLLKVESNQAVAINTWVGKNLSLHSSGIGKVLCAWLDHSELDKLFPREQLTQYTSHTITTKSELLNELQIIRSNGVAFDHEEDASSVNCIACPIFDNNQQVQAAISMSGVGNQFPKEKHVEYAQLLLESAKKIQQTIWGTV